MDFVLWHTLGWIGWPMLKTGVVMKREKRATTDDDGRWRDQLLQIGRPLATDVYSSRYTNRLCVALIGK